jgi:hypothetical protein
MSAVVTQLALTYQVSALLYCVLGICSIGDATHLQEQQDKICWFTRTMVV